MNKQLLERQLKLDRLEDEIADFKERAMQVYNKHWLSEYMQRQAQERIKRWEELAQRRYNNE